jgi:hypothetical protein
MDIDNKKLEEIIVRNKDITNAFLISIMNVDMTIYTCKTFSEMVKFEKENNNNQSLAGLLKHDSVQALTGLKVFRQYGDIFVDSINKMLVYEHRDDLLVKKDEMVDNWVQRIQNKKEGNLWVALYPLMFSLIKDINDGRVLEIREKNRVTIEAKQKENKQNNDNFLEDFIVENKKYIDAFLSDVKSKENEVDKYGLSDKTIFNTEIKDFIDRLLKNHGLKSFSEIKGSYAGFNTDLINYLITEYSKQTK